MHMSSDRHDPAITPTPPPAVSQRHRHRRLSVFGGIAAASLMVSLTACGSTGTGSTELVADVTTTTTTPAGSETTATPGAPEPEPSQAAWEDCLRSHDIDGLEVVNGGISFSASDDTAMAAFEAAQADCEPLLPDTGGDLELDPKLIAEQRDEALAFAACMRDNGVDYPDPVFDDQGGMSQTITGEIDGETFEQATEACGGVGGVSVGAGDGAPGFSLEQTAP